jgi:SAM-dependent methyltransferase
MIDPLILHFRSLGSWLEWRNQNTCVNSLEQTQVFLENIRQKGLYCPVNGLAKPGEISIKSSNLRETVSVFGLNSRTRAVLLLMLDVLHVPFEAEIYAPEDTTGFAKVLRRLFPNFIGSEYLPDDDAKAKRPSVRHEDVLDLTFPTASFDFYLSCEVLEHVPDVSLKLREAARILKSGAAFVGTFPFCHNQQATIHRAQLANNRIVHLLPPEYHGNPVDPMGGSLVFSVPGWDIVEIAKNAGFTGDIGFYAISSYKHGIRAADLATIFIFVAYR